jgi:hypothetical protein
MYKVPEQFRITDDVAMKMVKVFNVDPKNAFHWITKPNSGPQGFFILPNPKTMKGFFMICLASNGMGWEHVSISIPMENRCPTWPEMCFVKSLFWDAEDCVIQYHPPEKEYVNNHEFCLHLWRKKDENFETPPSIMVGTKS